MVQKMVIDDYDEVYDLWLNTAGMGYIYHTAIKEGCRRKGIGRLLAETVIKALEAEGINKVALLVFSGNEGGNEFWDSLGFIKREDIIYRNKNIRDFERIIK